MSFKIYLSGEIHSDWREKITQGVKDNGLDVLINSPVTNHEASDDCGEKILGAETEPFWRDHKAARINAIRIRKHIEEADLVVVRFGNQYKQWNAAFDAGYAAALGKSVITLHDETLTHALKEVDAAALAVCSSPEQVVEILSYTLSE
ncbi:MAG TPA: YtoQ family protein [Gammaproteobacteria bacterium]|nr:YtoQ family protein [Gammaproteobacteria bacterium]